MTTTENITNKPVKNPNGTNKVNKFLVVIIFLLLGFCGYLIWELLNTQQQVEVLTNTNTTITDERDQLQLELEDMLAQYEDMKTENEMLNAELEEEKAKIEELLKKVKGKDWSIYKLKKETATLRTIMKGYVNTIDSLNTLNVMLTEENATVKSELSTQKDKNSELTMENEGLNNKVTIASRLKALNVKAYGVKVRNNNTGKETGRAKKADKIRTTFTVLENTITPAGKKALYVRILTPSGKVLSERTDDSNKFDFNGVRGLYSVKKVIDYKNKQQSITMDWVKKADFEVGEYTVEIYNDGGDIGKTKFTLN